MHFTPLKLSHMFYNIIIRVAQKPKTTKRTHEMTPGFKHFRRMFKFVSWEELSEIYFSVT